MKVPKGTVIYVGGKKYRAGDEIPDELISVPEKPAARPRPGRPPKEKESERKEYPKP